MSDKTKQDVPEEFSKVIKDFISDIKTTFPEYQPFIAKWWKESDTFSHIPDPIEREAELKKAQENCTKFVFKFCLKKYPPRFFDILYQNNDIFKEDTEVDTEFLPFVHFKNLWECDISDKTRETIWKYLQLILFSVVGSLNDKSAFGDTAKLFESMDEDEFKGKLEETLDQMKDVFGNLGGEGGEGGEAGVGGGEGGRNFPRPNAENIQEHINGMLGGKLGKLAQEIAEETAKEFDIDMNAETVDTKTIFQNLVKDPTKLMGLVKTVGSKLDVKMKSGEIKESELMQEASELLQKMKTMPGMGDIQSMLGKMGLGGRNTKVNMSGMEAKLNENIKMAKMKERMRDNVEAKKQQKTAQDMLMQMQMQMQASQPKISDEELVKMFESEKPKKTKKTKGKK
jgi:hypothetical protein